ncbi:MAG: glycerol kinase GlpK [Chitinophagaceae bacterium]
MSLQYILALDQGTTSSRAILFNQRGEIVATAQREFRQIYPEPGWVEHDPGEIWSSQYQVMKEALENARVHAKDIAALGITNQRETTIVWDRATGEPVYPAIVWQDRRTAAYCDELKKQGHQTLVQQKTGLLIDAYFSGTKIKWILDHVPGAREKAQKGLLAFGTVDSWLVWKLTEGRLHITDASNASRTLLLNLQTGDWDEELLNLLTIPREILPKVVDSSANYGSTHLLDASVEIPIAGIAGDQQAALFGQQCTLPGMVKNTYGTGCFMLMNTGERRVPSKNNLLTTIAWKIQGRITYALEGSVFIAGAVVQWLRDGLHLFEHSSEIEQLAATVPDSGGVYLVPAFAGLGAPYWNPYARGAVFGLTRGSTDAHLARAALQSIAFQTYDVVQAMIADSGIAIQELRVDGGATVNTLLMQFQSDLLQTPVIRPKVYETTALGAAYLAGLAVNFWKNTDQLQQQWQEDTRFVPAQSAQQVKPDLLNWQRAVKASIAWAEPVH